MTIQQNRHFLLFSIWLLSISLLATILVACGASGDTVVITDFYMSPEPTVGRVVTLSVEVLTRADLNEADILVELPDAIKLISGSTTWHGSLTANQPYTHELTICVIEPGIWILRAGFGFMSSEGTGEGNTKFLYFDSQVNSAHFISEQEYFSSPDIGSTLEATRPVPEVLPECH